MDADLAALPDDIAALTGARMTLHVVIAPRSPQRAATRTSALLTQTLDRSSRRRRRLQ
jgi:hypothetical protein